MSEAVRPVGPGDAPPPFIGQAPAILRALYLARRFAPSDVPILIVGPTGSGKELLAQHIHAWSGRRGPLMDINCGALPRELVESTLFGHRRGAFSGALEHQTGLIEAAQGGTLLLDEICSMPIEAQIKLLRVLDSSMVRRMGETHSRRVDFRLVAASQERLAERAMAGHFRHDLLHRIAGVVIELPPLAERRGDIAALAAAFATRCGSGLADAAVRVLCDQRWPGNVRELRLVVERAAFLARTSTLDPEDVRDAIDLGAGGLGPASRRMSGEREWLLSVCGSEGWHAGRIAQRLGVGRSTLYRRLRDERISLRNMKSAHRLRADKGG